VVKTCFGVNGGKDVHGIAQLYLVVVGWWWLTIIRPSLIGLFGRFVTRPLTGLFAPSIVFDCHDHSLYVKIFYLHKLFVNYIIFR